MTCTNEWHTVDTWMRADLCPNCFDERGPRRRLAIVLERGRNPSCEYIGMVDVDDKGQIVYTFDQERGREVEIHRPLILHGDVWEYVQKSPDPRKPGSFQCVPSGTDWVPVGSVEMTEWIEVPVQNVRLAGAIGSAIYALEWERHSMGMERRGARLLEHFTKQLAAFKAEMSGIVQVPDGAGDEAAARIANIQDRIKGKAR